MTLQQIRFSRMQLFTATPFTTKWTYMLVCAAGWLVLPLRPCTRVRAMKCVHWSVLSHQSINLDRVAARNGCPTGRPLQVSLSETHNQTRSVTTSTNKCTRKPISIVYWKALTSDTKCRDCRVKSKSNMYDNSHYTQLNLLLPPTWLTLTLVLPHSTAAWPTGHVTARLVPLTWQHAIQIYLTWAIVVRL